jgi:hypothetical protein
MDALQQRCDELDRDKQHLHEVHQTNLDKLAAQVLQLTAMQAYTTQHCIQQHYTVLLLLCVDASWTVYMRMICCASTAYGTCTLRKQHYQC